MHAQGICDDIICKSKYWENINTHPQEPGYKHCDGSHTAKNYAAVKITARIHMI